MANKRWQMLAASALALLLCLCSLSGQGQNAPPTNVAGIPVNYDESLVGNYILPDPLVLAGGMRVRDAKTWERKRRHEIVRLFEEHQFGRSPGRPPGMSFEVFDKGTPALGGRAVRRQVGAEDGLAGLPARGGQKACPAPAESKLHRQL
jgi:hypothetical protein